MSLYDYYKNARNMTWEFLICNNIFNFPVNIEQLLTDYDVTIIADTKGLLPINIYSIGIQREKLKIIIYRKSGSNETDRFTLAHELGHIVLKTKCRSEFEEEQANIFASRLLMPLIIIKHHSLDSVEKISNFFGVSEAAAKIRLKRFSATDERGKYLTHPLEKQYYQKYCEINNYKPKL